MRLKDKVAFVTGCGQGIGRAVCLLFADQGAKIAGLDIDEDAGARTAEKVRSKGGDAVFLKCDVADEAQVKKAVNSAVATFGGLDILVNNAAVLWRDKDFAVTETTEVNWDRVISINLKGAVWVCKYGIPELKKSGNGAIVNIGSGVAYMGFTQAQDAYTASKGALISLTRSMAMTLAKANVRVNIVHPGPVDTPMQAEWDEPTRSEISEWVPLGRLAAPQDIANSVLFLASEEAAYITGTELFVDGGLMVKAR